MSTPDCSCKQQTASATSQASAITTSGDLVTATASATASSPVSYTDALAIATNEAKQLASEYAHHDAKVIDQTLTILKSRSLIPKNSDVTVGSPQIPYSKIYSTDAFTQNSYSTDTFTQNSYSIGNNIKLTSSTNKLLVNGAQVFTADNRQGSELNPIGVYYGYGALGQYPPSFNKKSMKLKSGDSPDVNDDNSAFGNYCMAGNSLSVTGYANTGCGAASLYSLSDGSNNVAVGNNSLDGLTGGNQNTAIGALSLRAIIDGSNNIAIGYGADVNDPSLTNCTVIGAGAVGTGSNQIILGNKSVTTVLCSGTISAPTFVGALSGNATTATNLASTSVPANAIPYQSANNTTKFTTVTGTSGQVLTVGTSGVPAWSSPSVITNYVSTTTTSNQTIVSPLTINLSSAPAGTAYLNFNTSNVGVAGTNRISLYSGYGFGIDSSTLKYLSDGGTHAFYTGGSASANGTLAASITSGGVTATTFVGALTGNATTASNLASSGVSANAIPYQSANNTTSFTSGTGTSGQVLTVGSNGIPAWANAGSVTNYVSTTTTGNQSISSALTINVTSTLPAGSAYLYFNNYNVGAAGTNRISLFDGYGLGIDGSTLKYLSNGGYHKFYTGGTSSVNGTLAATITSSGVTATTFTGALSGNATSASGLINTPNITVGNVYAGAYFLTSDYRVKKNVRPLNDTYTVDNLRPVSYYNKLTEKPDIGLIAHEVQEVYPFMVSGEKDGEQNQSVNYIALIGVLIKEIQQLKERVNTLENK